LWCDPAFKEADEFIVRQWASFIDGLALSLTSDTSDLGSQVKLNGGGEYVNKGHTFGGTRKGSRGLLQAIAKVLVGKGFQRDRKVGLGINLANKSLHAVILVVDGSLKKNLQNKKYVLFKILFVKYKSDVQPVPVGILNVLNVGVWDGSTVTAEVTPASESAMVSAGQSVTHFEPDEGTDQDTLHHWSGGKKQNNEKVDQPHGEGLEGKRKSVLNQNH